MIVKLDDHTSARLVKHRDGSKTLRICQFLLDNNVIEIQDDSILALKKLLENLEKGKETAK